MMSYDKPWEAMKRKENNPIQPQQKSTTSAPAKSPRDESDSPTPSRRSGKCRLAPWRMVWNISPRGQKFCRTNSAKRGSGIDDDEKLLYTLELSMHFFIVTPLLFLLNHISNIQIYMYDTYCHFFSKNRNENNYSLFISASDFIIHYSLKTLSNE